MAGTNANDPNLSIGVTSFKAIASHNFTLIDFKIFGFDIDRHNLAMITFLDLGSHPSFINLVPSSSKFFFAVLWLSNCHRRNLDFNIVFLFYPE
jgi:hypothetical protein